MSDKNLPKNAREFQRAFVLRPDNFTPRSRTPWGGTRISIRYKGLSKRVIGESWEVSVEPDFPSKTVEGFSLQALIDANPAATLGDDAERGFSLLVKLLDADAPLSVQIHPTDDDPALSESESGKPESWYILDAQPGAALYLGLAPGVDRPAMERALKKRGDVSALLNRVECKPGDFFVLPAGTPHALGGGLTLVEPQRVLPGRRGLTYRYWDWNRRYDDHGVESVDGKPRELHTDRALAVTDWDMPRGEAGVDALRYRAGTFEPGDAPCIDGLAAPTIREAMDGGGLHFPALSVRRVRGTGMLALPLANYPQALTVVGGTVDVAGARIEAGQTAFLPACLKAPLMNLAGAHALLCAAR